MKAIAFGNRLARDLNTTSVLELSSDMRLEILDAINGGLQGLHAFAPHESKKTTASLSVAAPKAISLTVADSSFTISDYNFSNDDIGCVIRINGDDVDNQVCDAQTILYPYIGASGTVGATIYYDAISIPEIYEELVGDPMILETGRTLYSQRQSSLPRRRRTVAVPKSYWVEANARNQNPLAPAIIRFDPIPDRAYRFTVEATLAPDRVNFADLLAPGIDIPLRAEHIELYLLPVARAILTSSDGWKDKETKAAALAASEKAIAAYAALAPKTLFTPSNRVGTRRGF